jgi:hypothetical protein
VLGCLTAFFAFGGAPTSDRPAQASVVRDTAAKAPLAYIRTINLLPVALKTSPDSPVPPRPPSNEKAALRRWELTANELAQTKKLKALAVDQFSDTLRDRLASVGGLTVLPEGDASPADARLHLTIDRVGAHTGASREIWLRAVARLELSVGERTFGPYYGIGQAVSPKWIIKPGYVWPDSELMAEAARQASRQIVQSLRTGREAVFVRATRVAVLPAIIDSTAEKVFEGKDGETTISARGIQRLADVLFQPGLTPVVDRADSDEVAAAMRKLGVSSADLWDVVGNPAKDAAAIVGRALKAEYVFVSRAREMTLTGRTSVIQQFGITREGEEIQAEMEVSGAFVRCGDASVLWLDKVTGSSSARTQFTRHGPRLRKEDQCLADAARVGYAWLRSSFENYKRQYE